MKYVYSMGEGSCGDLFALQVVNGLCICRNLKERCAVLATCCVDVVWCCPLSLSQALCTTPLEDFLCHAVCHIRLILPLLAQ